MMEKEKMINIKGKLTEKANFNLRKYTLNNHFTNKEIALNHLLENYDFNEDVQEGRGKRKVRA